MFLKGKHFVMGGHINMNGGVFWEASVGFLKYSQSNVNLNVKSRANSTAFKK